MVRRLISAMVADRGENEFGAFVAALRWVDSDFERWSDAAGISPSLRLALVWEHAHRLHASIAGLGPSIDWAGVRDIFDAAARRVTPSYSSATTATTLISRTHGARTGEASC